MGLRIDFLNLFFFFLPDCVRRKYTRIHTYIHANIQRHTLSKSISYFDKMSLFLIVNKIGPENTVVLICIKAIYTHNHTILFLN